MAFSLTPRFAPEPPYQHGQAPRTAILLCNLGTPEAPTPAAVRRYLGQFLSDPRVVELPRLLWLPILHGIILRTRPAKSAAKYASIWTEQGSPLLAWTRTQAQLLQQALQRSGHDVLVQPAMRYGEPAIARQLDTLKAAGATRILVLPLYPQYSGTTTASVGDAVGAWALRQRHVPELRYVQRYHDHPGYIAALAASVQAHWQAHGRAQHLVMSFHGVPERTLHLGDPYHCEARKTARLLAEQLGLAPQTYSVTFQSRFGKAKWLEPATEPTLQQLASSGTRSVEVLCPGFTSDCLETLEEISQEARETFLHAGGEAFHYIPCLNDNPLWISALEHIALNHLAGWPTHPDPHHASTGAASRARALALGAKQ